MDRFNFERMAAVLFFIALAFTACLMPAQNDTWWHLRAGQVIVETRSIPLHDTFSHTVNGGYWPDHEWLSQVIFYVVYRAGGMPLLTAFAAAIVTLSWMMVWSLIPGRSLVRIGLSVLALGATAGEWSIRPQIFTLLFLAVTARCLVRRRHALLPLVFLIWANLHGGVTLGVVFLGAATLVEIAAAGAIVTKPLIQMVIATLLTMATPLGWSLWTEIPGSVARLQSYRVQEWRPPDFTDPMLLPLLVLVVLFVVLFLRERPWRAISTDDVLLWASVAMFLPAFSLSRNLPALEVAMVPAVGQLLSRRLSVKTSQQLRTERPLLNAGLVAAALIAATVVVAGAWRAPSPRLAWQPLSSDAIAALRSCPGPLYNTYDDGGYVIWFAPEVRVFIDSRQDPYPADLVREHIAVEDSGNYQALFTRFGIRCALGATDSRVMQQLREDGWRTSFSGTLSVLRQN
ncbi:MAG TPA: hypothetical protein VJP86_02490 [Vicinamibacterales bacterium]|jgi:hypothetical protein|nr:hypothetical protein [Vicinamibacterales bacterium]